MTEPRAYHPDQREIPCRVLTTAGWVSGRFHVPRKAHLLDQLNRDEPFFRLTSVSLPGDPGVHPFFALTRAGAIVVVPDEPEAPRSAANASSMARHGTRWLLDGGGIVEGTLSLLPGVRVSDHLMHRSGYVELSDCSLFLPDGKGSLTAELGIESLALQSARAIGVTELDGP